MSLRLGYLWFNLLLNFYNSTIETVYIGVDDLSPAEEVQKRYEKALGLAKEGLSACIDPTGGRQETWNVVISRMEKLIKLMKDLQNM